MLRCILVWFAPLSVVAFVLAVFDIFPQQHHWLISLVYIGVVFFCVCRCIGRARRDGARQALRGYSRLLREDDPRIQEDDLVYRDG